VYLLVILKIQKRYECYYCDICCLLCHHGCHLSRKKIPFLASLHFRRRNRL